MKGEDNYLEEFQLVSSKCKGELWNDIEDILFDICDFMPVDSYTYKSMDTGGVYKFITSGKDEEKYVVRIERLTDDGLKYCFLKTCEPKAKELEDKFCKKMSLHEARFHVNLMSKVGVLNDYWKSKQNQDSYYKKDKERIDRVLSTFTELGFDFSSEMTIDDALKIGEYYCVMESEKRTNNSRLYKTVMLEDTQEIYFYKAKYDEHIDCLISGIFIKYSISKDLFDYLKVCNKYRVY